MYRSGVIGGDAKPLDPPNPPLLLRKLKDGGFGLAGNSRLALGQPALLRRDKAAERAAFPPINGVVPFVMVAAGGPGFGLGKGVGLVDAAVEGLAPVFGQGFQDGRSAVVVGKGLPIGTVPRGGPGGLEDAIPGPQQQQKKSDAGDKEFGHKGPPTEAPKTRKNARWG